MSEETKVAPVPLTQEQEKVLREIYSYEDAYELTTADMELAAIMFDTPDKFKLLRKILNIHTQEEKGITFKNPHMLIESSLAQKEAYAVETAVSQLADERIRTALVSMYVKIRHHLQAKKEAEFNEANNVAADEEKRSEEYDEEQAEANRTLGEAL